MDESSFGCSMCNVHAMCTCAKAAMSTTMPGMTCGYGRKQLFVIPLMCAETKSFVAQWLRDRASCSLD